jgi:hypothetical protein
VESENFKERNLFNLWEKFSLKYLKSKETYINRFLNDQRCKTMVKTV